MNIEVGEYARTTDGIICKITDTDICEICGEKIYIVDINYQGKIYHENNIIKHSKNIIDLIEVGDYVNGYKVDVKESTLLITKAEGIDHSGYSLPISQYGENIKTILTHEQYKSNCYKLGDE